MKIYNISLKLFGAFLIFALTVSSCNWIDTDINVSPNNPTDASMPDLLPQIILASAYTKGGDLARFSTIPMQQMAGVDRQSAAFERYLINESDINNLWNSSYADILKNAQLILKKAEDLGAPHYAGVAKVLMADRLGRLTSVWGDIPYSEALTGDEGNLTPAYDSQESVYSAIQSLLDSAIEDFAKPAGPIALRANADLFFKGDVAKWSKAAQGLKAKFALHLSKRNGYAPVLAALQGNIVASNADNMVFKFGEANNELNPIYQFDQLRTDIRASNTIVSMMNATNDPRRSKFFTPQADGSFVGSNPGESNTAASFLGSAFGAKASPVYFVTFAELKFIEAEAKLASDAAGAATAYNDAVKASLTQFAVSDSVWVASNANETAGSITLEKIINAKYIHNCTDSEVWVDWRRTGFPNLSIAPNPATPNNQIPRRFVYPLGERLYNGSNMPTGQLQDQKVWWDNN